MSRLRLYLTVFTVLSMVVVACNTQPKEDPRVAELQKELDAAKQQLATTKSAEDAPAAAATAASAGPTAAEKQSQSAAQAAAQAAEQASRERAATEQALADQKAAAAKQAQENERLKREIEEAKPREFTLPAGTVLPVRTTAELSTKSVKNGSVFDALLEQDLVVDGTTLAKAGSRVSCIVVSSDPGGRVKGVASMAVAARSIAGAGGNTINVKTDSYGVEANTTKGRDAKRTGIATGAGAVIGAIAGGGSGAAIGAGAGAAAGVGANMATRGDAAVIPTETLIEFTLSAPATVVFRK
jgi:hypothetical protein